MQYPKARSLSGRDEDLGKGLISCTRSPTALCQTKTEQRSWVQQYETCTFYHSTARLGAPSTVLSPCLGPETARNGLSTPAHPCVGRRKVDHGSNPGLAASDPVLQQTAAASQNRQAETHTYHEKKKNSLSCNPDLWFVLSFKKMVWIK